MHLDKDAFTIEFDASVTTLEDMYGAIIALGYTPRLSPPESPDASASAAGGDVPEPVLQALTQARRDNKLVFVDFFAEWCIACKALEQQVLGADAVQAALADYLILKIDTDLEPRVAMFYAIVGMPTLLVLTAAGEEIYRSVGPVASAALADALTEMTRAH